MLTKQLLSQIVADKDYLVNFLIILLAYFKICRIVGTSDGITTNTTNVLVQLLVKIVFDASHCLIISLLIHLHAKI